MLSHIIKKSVVLFIARSGFSDTEYTIIKELLKSKGYSVFTASDEVSFCISDRSRRIKSDIKIANITPGSFSALILTGGRGVADYRNNHLLSKKIRAFTDSGKLTAAICAAPVLLADAGVLAGKTAVCHDSVKLELTKYCSVLNHIGVCFDSGILTASDALFAAEFAIKIDTILNTGK